MKAAIASVKIADVNTLDKDATIPCRFGLSGNTVQIAGVTVVN